MRAFLMAPLIAMTVAGAPARAQVSPRARAKIAVTEVRNVQGVAEGTATILSDIVVSEVARSGFDVVSQADIGAMIGFERQKQVLGCSEDSSCLAEIGGALGVDYMLTGQVGQIGTRYRISLLLVDTKKARVVARAARFCDQNEDALARTAEVTVGELLAGVRGAPAIPVPGVAEKRSAPSLEVKPPPPTAVPPPTRAPAATATRRSRNRVPAYVTMGAGGALLLAGAITGVVARARYDDLASRQSEMGYYDAYLAERNGIRSLSITADVLMVTGVAAAGAGGFLWWRAGRGEIAVLPSAAGGTVGLAAAGRF